MSTTGRFYVRDQQSGRRFCVEPISNRSQKVNDKTFDNGGIDDVKGGGIRADQSIIRSENGFTNITDLPAGTDPMSAIDRMLKQA